MKEYESVSVAAGGGTMITSPQTMSAGEAGKYYYKTKEHTAE